MNASKFMDRLNKIVIVFWLCSSIFLAYYFRIWDPLRDSRPMIRKLDNLVICGLHCRVFNMNLESMHLRETETIRIIGNRTGRPINIAFDDSGEMLAISEKNGGRLRIFPSGAVLTEGGGPIAFHPHGNQLASGTFERGPRTIGPYLKLWNTSSLEEIVTLQSGRIVSSLAYNPSGDMLASASYNLNDPSNDIDPFIDIWNMTTFSLVATLQQHQDRVLSMAYNSNGTILASASQDCSIILWHARFLNVIAIFRSINSPAMSLSFNPSGTMLAICFRGGTTPGLKIWNMLSLGQDPITVTTTSCQGVSYYKLREVLGAVSSSRVTFFNASTFKEIFWVRIEAPFSSAFFSFLFRP
jgi:WD40 repeat protein